MWLALQEDQELDSDLEQQQSCRYGVSGTGSGLAGRTGRVLPAGGSPACPHCGRLESKPTTCAGAVSEHGASPRTGAHAAEAAGVGAGAAGALACHGAALRRGAGQCDPKPHELRDGLRVVVTLHGCFRQPAASQHAQWRPACNRHLRARATRRPGRSEPHAAGGSACLERKASRVLTLGRGLLLLEFAAGGMCADGSWCGRSWFRSAHLF